MWVFGSLVFLVPAICLTAPILATGRILEDETRDGQAVSPCVVLSESSLLIVWASPDDQSCPTLAAHIRPRPLQENAEPQAGFGEELNVYECPYEPGCKAAQLNARTL